MTEGYKNLIELAGLAKLKELQIRVAAESNVHAIILDNEGNSLMEYSDWQACSGGPDYSRFCGEFHARLFAMAKESKQLELNTCPFTKLSSAALPIFLEGSLVCVWIICRFQYAREGMEETKGGSAPLFNMEGLNILYNFIHLLMEDAFQLRQYTTQLSKARESATSSMFFDRFGYPNSLSLERDLQDDKYNTLFIMDISDLRKINDVYGRECGDLLLLAVGSYLEELKLDSSRIYRLDAADFALLLQETDHNWLVSLARRVHERCRQPWVLTTNGQKRNIFVNVTIGVLPVDRDSITVHENLSSAIEFTLERSGFSEGIAFFDKEANQVFHSKLRLELSLRGAVRNGMKGFSLCYQPIIDPGIAMWRGVEALCRWDSDEFGPIPPTEFIPIAEATGLIGELGLWALRTAVVQVKKWQLDELENFILDVNLSPVQLANPQLDKMIITILEEERYPPEKLCLEITESNELNFTVHALGCIERLNELGVIIALDDFGTGYASLSMLHRLPVKILKTDRSLVQGMENDTFLQRLFHVIMEMAHSSGMRVVAEGVETNQQANLLLKQGADYFQGYQFSRPLAVPVLEENLDRFFKPYGELVSMGYSRLDLSRLSDEYGGYDLTPALNKLLSRCMQKLFSEPDSDSTVSFVLGEIGSHLRVSRAYVFIRERNGSFSNTHEWCRQGIRAEKENLQMVPIEQVSPNWLRTLKEDGILVAADIRTLEKRAYEDLNAQGIRAIAAFPIWDGEQLYGFVGFDDCESIHYWSREEVQMLHTMTSVITATLNNMRLQHKVSEQNLLLERMLNRMDTMIYVSDPDTGEILFANTALKEAYNKELLGEICWKAIEGRAERCDWCPTEFLLAHQGESYEWELFNEQLGAYLHVKNSLLYWTDGKLAQMSYAQDITERKQYQDRLELFAATDMMTNTLNRVSFIEAATVVLHRANNSETAATVVFVDIDRLKEENRIHGHAAGDELIRAVVQALTVNIRKTDLIGRYGGDEFVLLLENCTPEQAAKRIVEAQKTLLETGQGRGIPAYYNFSYGLAGSRDVAYRPGTEYLEELLRLADDRMRAYRKEKRKDGGNGISSGGI